MSLILSPFSVLLKMLYGVLNSYGLALMCFAVFVKILLFPFALKGKRGMIAMNMISGKMAQLKKQYGNNPQKYNEEVQALYLREQVNPMSGCLWTFLPLFVLIPLYAIIKEPLTHISGLSEDQILMLANQLNWDTVAVEMQFVTQEAVDKVLAKSIEAGGTLVSGFTADIYNQLYLASLIPENGVVLSDGAVVEYMNFHMFGIDLTNIPTWMIWQDLSYNNIGGLILVAISACTGILVSKVAQKTNKLSQTQERNEQMEQSQRIMMFTMPLMSIWIGLIMPSLMVIYWITNNFTSMIQEMVAGVILKKDYEEALRVSERHKAEQKEQERLEKEKKKKEIEEKKLEVQNQKGKGKKKKEKKERIDEETGVKLDKEASREGLRQYARGRSYDPKRYPNPHELGENVPVVPMNSTISLEKSGDIPTDEKLVSHEKEEIEEIGEIEGTEENGNNEE